MALSIHDPKIHALSRHFPHETRQLHGGHLPFSDQPIIDCAQLVFLLAELGDANAFALVRDGFAEIFRLLHGLEVGALASLAFLAPLTVGLQQVAALLRLERLGISLTDASVKIVSAWAMGWATRSSCSLDMLVLLYLL